MNQDQTPIRAATPEIDKAKLAPANQGADKSPAELGTQPKPQPVQETAPASPPKV